jgi:hypothetical protein
MRGDEVLWSRCSLRTVVSHQHPILNGGKQWDANNARLAMNKRVIHTSRRTSHSPLRSVTGYPPTGGSGLRGGCVRIKDRTSGFVKTAD